MPIVDIARLWNNLIIQLIAEHYSREESKSLLFAKHAAVALAVDPVVMKRTRSVVLVA